MMLEEDMVIDLQGLSELLRSLFAYGTLAVFHLRNMALGNACHMGKLHLRDPFFCPCPSKRDTRQLGIRPAWEALPPGDSIPCFLEPKARQRVTCSLSVIQRSHKGQGAHGVSTGLFRAYRHRPPQQDADDCLVPPRQRRK